MRIKNRKQFETAIDEYVVSGIVDPVEIARALNLRGCICAAVAVQLYLSQTTSSCAACIDAGEYIPVTEIQGRELRLKDLLKDLALK